MRFAGSRENATLARPTLVVGWGNLLRRDDGVGAFVAERVALTGPAGVETSVLHQLTPEVAAEMAAFEDVIFVDAYLAHPGAGVNVSEVTPQPAAKTGLLAHHLSPAGLLSLCRKLYGETPRCRVVAVPAFDLTLGEGLSPRTRTAAELAVRLICDHMVKNRQPKV